MQVYDKKKVEKLINAYNHEQQQKAAVLGAYGNAFVTEARNFVDGKSMPFPTLDRILTDTVHGKYKKFSEIFEGDLFGAVFRYLPKQFHDDFIYIIDRLPSFQYATSMSRRSMRSRNLESSFRNVLRIFVEFDRMGVFRCSLHALLKGDLDANLATYRERMGMYFNYENILAAELDIGNREIEDLIRETFLSDNNTNIVTRSMIRGIAKSKNVRMHLLLGDLLLAARLQEGLRQAICENIDCGTPEAFLRLFQVIETNHLDRFPAVKRAIATWTGICSEEHLERISDKLLRLISECLNSPDSRQQYLESRDSVELYIALWSIGFYAIEDTFPILEDLFINGERHQKLLVSYFIRSLDQTDTMNRLSKNIMLQNPDDYEILACFMPSYLGNLVGKEYQIRNSGTSEKDRASLLSLHKYFEDEAEAVTHFEFLYRLASSLPKKDIIFSPCIFPWYSVSLNKSDLLRRLFLIAAVINKDAYTDRAVELIPAMSSGGYSARHVFVELLLKRPRTPVQRYNLIRLLADKESSTADEAYKYCKIIDLQPSENRMIEEFFSYKSAVIRSNISELLYRQSDEDLIPCIERLIRSNDAQKRAGGLDLLLRLSKDLPRCATFQKAVHLTQHIPVPSPSERILIEEINGDTKSSQILSTEGLGLYNPKAVIYFPAEKTDTGMLRKFFGEEKKTIFQSIFGSKKNALSEKVRGVIVKLDALFVANAKLEYRTSLSSEAYLLGDRFSIVSYDSFAVGIDKLPCTDLWRTFYQEEIHDYGTLLQVYVYWMAMFIEPEHQAFRVLFLSVFGPTLFTADPVRPKYQKHIKTLLDAYLDTYKDESVLAPLACAVLQGINAKTDDDMGMVIDRKWGKSISYIVNEPILRPFIYSLLQSPDDKIFSSIFPLLHTLDRKIWKTRRKVSDNPAVYSYMTAKQGSVGINILHYIRAKCLGLLSEDNVYKALFEELNLSDSLKLLSSTVRDNLTPYERRNLYSTLGINESEALSVEALAERCPIAADAQVLYMRAVETILSIELRRGDSETLFSRQIPSIHRIFGLRYFVSILLALDEEKLSRGNRYYYFSGSRSQPVPKKDSLSHLLKVCYPLPTDTADTLRAMPERKDLTELRLIEAAMYAPQWVDLIGDTLGHEGFRSCCYYFMAHMNETFDEELTARIAKFTPISTEDLNNGAFDINWFKEAYATVGDALFQKFYKSAKYITTGSKHSRAQKYADAVTGKFNLEETAAEILDKRNKDLLISYSLIPLRDESADLLDRYRFLQKFLKDSKQFGAQRRASESKAVEIALANLALNAGYSDVMRLTIQMENELFSANAGFFEGIDIENTTVSIHVSEEGKASLICKRAAKTLASAPANIKKNPQYIEIAAFNKELQQQYSRSRKMFEQAMEDKTIFRVSEFVMLEKNPVIGPLLRPLVFVTDLQGAKPLAGFLRHEVLCDAQGREIPVSPDTLVRIAHPFDLYSLGIWSAYQQYLYTQSIAQPFKQVFRELYLKTEDEKDALHSLRYAGNQINPQKTVAVLKGRRWIADYEDGLQKVFYKENLVARIYAMADWFSPSDILAPTLEWVEFSHRKTGQIVNLTEVPEILFSEVMRDVDLAVSVAHAGGVDPETSHSTIEMRSAIVSFSLPLFRLTNVTLQKNFAIVQGSRAEYSIHLGSGVVHQIGGAQINVLPVHTQSRGRLFLPFLDEDPKTAEILSKVVLFAEDQKLKDPSILEQILH